MTLQCDSQEAYDRFILMKGNWKFSIAEPSHNTTTGIFQAAFNVGPVLTNQRWRFICYGYYSSSPELWSEPSNHLELLVSGKEALSSPFNDITSDTGPDVW